MSAAVDRGTAVGCCGRSSRGSRQGREHGAEDDGAVLFVRQGARKYCVQMRCDRCVLFAITVAHGEIAFSRGRNL